MNNTYYSTYKLLKELPDYKTGWLFSWCGMRRNYLPHSPDCFMETGVSRYGKDYDSKTTFTKEEVELKSDWFEPFGESQVWIPVFPKRLDLKEFVNLEAETRLVDTVDFCRAFNDMTEDPDFTEALYQFYKESYNKRYGL